MSFFIRKGNTDASFKRKIKSKVGGGRKKIQKGNIQTKKKHIDNPVIDDEEILSEVEFSDKESDNEIEHDVETTQAIKLKLTSKFLEEIEKEEQERLERSEIDDALVANRLKEDNLSQAGKLRRKVADNLVGVKDSQIHVLRNKNHSLSITSVVISHDTKHLYSASKDGVIIKWDVDTREKVGIIQSFHNLKDKKKHSHKGVISCLAISSDNRFLASGDVTNIIHIWNPKTLEHIHTFKGHSGPITGIAICNETNNLYSSSGDRSIKVWNLEEMMYVETLFGHQLGVTSIDVLCKNRAVSSGGTDNTVRVWKIQEESQLIFNGGGRSIDVVKRLDDNHYVSCGEDGHVCVWGILKKKPLHTIIDAHGTDSITNEPNWVSSIATISTSDVFASGSYNGCIKVWKSEDNYRNSQLLFTIPVKGFINSMAFSSDDRYLIVGVGQEHRLGRWSRVKEAKNSVLIIELNKNSRLLNGKFSNQGMLLIVKSGFWNNTKYPGAVVNTLHL